MDIRGVGVHVNFKNLNKLVKGNLVRGLPSKIFQNDYTCVACQKGKQHKAFYKAKTVSYISHSLQLLHMDLFGPTSVRSLNHKTYYLVITDDFSRFSWVFFLRTKDETSGILKDFIRQIENQLNQKVKTIRCDNDTEFKNRDFIEFCGSKVIKREYRKGPTWLFDLDYLTDSMNYQHVRSENQANKHAGPQEANHNAGTQDKIDACDYKKEDKSAQDYFILPIWSSYSSTIKRSTAKDAEIPALEDIYEHPTDGIFTNSSYDDEGAVADFTNLETAVNVSPIPTSRINSIHPSTLILEDPQSAIYLMGRTIGTKWVYRNKKDERGVVVRNKARIEAIRIFLAFASYMGFIVYQMDVKSAFLYGKIDEEVYVSQPPSFLDPKYPQKVYKVVKALYGLHQAPRACQDKYVAEILKKFDFVNVKTASTPIETQKPLVKDEEASDVDVHLYRSMIGSLMYLTASRPDIMFAICACSRFQVTPKTSHLSAVKRIFRYLKGKPKLGFWYPRVSSFDLEAYSDSDYAGANLDRKSTTRGCQCLGRRLISWQCKKQTIVATSTTEAEYVAAVNCCGQVLWIQNQMLDFGFNFMNTKIYIDNESTICIVKNPVYHSQTKHIAIRHHFIRDAYEKKLIQVLKIHTDDNVADLLTKAFDFVQVPLDHFPVNALTSKVFSFMVKKGKHFSGKITPLFAFMLVQPTEDEGAISERPSEAQPTPSPPHPSEAIVEPQSDLFARPLPSTYIPDSILESSNGNQGGHSSSDKSLSG
ncbi:putative ribonuclease H-like domain-containing protein, partial [Tanacetum coccineum]